jgi:hypothetical protein
VRLVAGFGALGLQLVLRSRDLMDWGSVGSWEQSFKNFSRVCIKFVERFHATFLHCGWLAARVDVFVGKKVLFRTSAVRKQLLF